MKFENTSDIKGIRSELSTKGLKCKALLFALNIEKSNALQLNVFQIILQM